MDIEAIKPTKDMSAIDEMLKREFCDRFIDSRTGQVRPELLVKRLCPLCGSDRASPLFDKDHLTYVGCDCGMVFISPNLDEKVRIDWYTTSESYSWFWREVVLKKRNQRIENIWLPRRTNLQSLGVSLEAVLDVGCGCGEFLQVMSELPFGRLQGVEPNRSAVEIARQHVGDIVRQGTLDNIDDKPGSLSLVTFWEVLHHFESPLSAIHRVRDLLRPGGHLVFQSPNFAGFDYRLLGSRHHDVNFSIPNYFSTGTIRRLLMDGGFAPNNVHISTPGRLDVDYVLRVMTSDGDQVIADGMWKALLGQISSGDANLKNDLQALLQTYGHSGSMLVVAKR